MKVELIAAPQIRSAAWPYLAPQATSTYSEYLIEFAGRVCYQSWSRPNPETADTRDYVRKNIIGKQHESVLEHAFFTFYVQGVSRALLTELERHRHLSFSVISQRYVDHDPEWIVTPPLIAENPDTAGAVFDDAVEHALDAYKTLAEELIGRGYRRKQAFEAARAVLPNAAEVKMVVTGNARAWRHIIGLRGSEHADAEIREFAIRVLELLYEEAPSVFGDFSIVELPNGRRVVE